MAHWFAIKFSSRHFEQWYSVPVLSCNFALRLNLTTCFHCQNLVCQHTGSVDLADGSAGGAFLTKYLNNPHMNPQSVTACFEGEESSGLDPAMHKMKHISTSYTSACTRSSGKHIYVTVP